jgi:hypothetical protein
MKIALAIALATSAAPSFALAQSYYDRSYCDDSGCYDHGYYYRQVYGYPVYDADRGVYYDDYGYVVQRYDAPVAHGYTYTGRVGSHWIDAYGRSCAWREVAWRDNDGFAATKWIATCRG